MKYDKKRAIFKDIIINKADEQRLAVGREINDNFNRAVAEAVRAAEAQAQAQIQAETYKVKRYKNKEIVMASSEAKRSLMGLRERLTGELFDEIIAKIKEFTAAPEYEDFLINGIKNVLATSKSNYAYVQVVPADMRLIARIEAETRLTVLAMENAECLGGFKLMTADKRMINDCTLIERIQDARLNFSMLYNGAGNKPGLSF